MADKLTLTPMERQSPLWLELMAHFEKRLAHLRIQNEGPLDPIKTADMRGRIAEIKALMDLDIDKENLPPL